MNLHPFFASHTRPSRAYGTWNLAKLSKSKPTPRTTHPRLFTPHPLHSGWSTWNLRPVADSAPPARVHSAPTRGQDDLASLTPPQFRMSHSCFAHIKTSHRPPSSPIVYTPPSTNSPRSIPSIITAPFCHPNFTILHSLPPPILHPSLHPFYTPLANPSATSPATTPASHFTSFPPSLPPPRQIRPAALGSGLSPGSQGGPCRCRGSRTWMRIRIRIRIE